MIFIYITCRDKKEAKTIAKELIKKRLIACANIFPIDSLYRWKGKIAEEKEVALLCKTQDGSYNDVAKAVKKMHSYDVPCIIKIKGDANKSYADWIYKETFR
ncbi:MAG: divalent-cation tolerance protein CutA [Nanoarchaeota archaeon]|nr:divalent-cation tolerance protein CutA [Nanoarchaeota archaeon]